MSAKLRKLLALAVRPRFWPALRLGVAPTVEHDAALGRFEFRTVIDIGANKGQFAAYAATRWPGAAIECFEPLPGPRAQLQAVLARYAKGRSRLHAVACGAAKGEAEMHVATREDSSSLLPLGERQKSMFGMDEAASLPVPVMRLDEALDRPGLAKPALVKIDVQGFEYQVLEGASALLPSIEAVYVEASFVELYEGQRFAADITALLHSHGFRKVGEFNTCRSPDGAPVQADLLFERAHAMREAA